MGVLLALQAHRARAARAAGQPGPAADAAREALALLAEDFAPDAMYLAEVHLVAWQALQAAGAQTEAAAVLAAGSQWIRTHALPQVPAPFLDSFLNRNPVNRTLLAAATVGCHPTLSATGGRGG